MSQCVCLDSEMPFCSRTGIFTSVYSPGAAAEEKELVPSYEDLFDPCEIPVFAPPSKVSAALWGIQMFLISTWVDGKKKK